MLTARPERIAFKADEALCLLENRNLKDRNNRFLKQFKEFVGLMKEVRV